MKHKIQFLLILLLICSNTFAQQNYPVRTMVQYTPPYSLFLGDFATPKLIVTLTGQDLLDANCPIKLSISLECQNVKVTTKPSYSPTPIYINGGQTIVLTGADLAQYFDIHNLDFQGITAAKYLQDGQLPEGLYRLNVKVINYKDNKTISNTAFKLFNARMGKPPLLAQPKNKTLIPPAQQTMPIVFSWTPQTIGAFRYVFELWECAVPGIPVETVVSTVRPVDTQTFNTSQFSFHPATVNMKPGTEYAWRVTVEDPHNQQRFSNQGRSEIFTFTYKRKPEEVSGLSYTNRGLKITYNWDMSPAHTKYNFQYFDPQTNHTVNVPCDYNSYTLNIPSRGYHLKVRVQAECYNDPTLLSNYTPYLDTYLEPIPTPDYECGKTFDDREITNKELKHSLAPGEILESKNGDTRFEIISAAEKNGYLSGEFYMIMDCWGGAKIKCEFSDAEVNTDNILLDAEFHNIPDSTLFIKPETIRKEIQEAFFDAATVLTDFSIKDTVKIDKPYTYLYINESGKVMAVIDDKGKIKTEETTISATNLKENTLIQGKNGEELVLTKKGQVMGKTEFNATGGNSVLLKEYHRKSDSLAQWQINFSKYDAQTYAFDHIGSGNHGIFSSSEYYPQVGSYDFRYKSVECGKNDKVIVEFDTYPEKDSVVFKDKYGVKLKVVDGNILTFTGVSKADTNYIYAYRGDQKIGKLFLNTYQQKTYQVVLISVNEAKLPNTKDLENYLNKVYNQCAVSFKIETRKLQVSGIENFTHGGTKVAGSVWNASQKAVLEAFGEKYEDNTAYLFFIPKAETGGVAGYMPRYYPYGFIYPGAANRTIAHELGHGIAGLEHPFPESQVSGNTANLMDYRDGEELWHFQWDMLQDPSRKIFKWWQNEEDAEAYKNNSNWICIKSEIIDKIKQISNYFYLPNGKIADYTGYYPSGFYTSADGDAPRSTGAVASIRYNDYDFILVYKTLEEDNRIYQNLGYGQKVNNEQGKEIAVTSFPIKELNYEAKYQPIKVIVEGQKASVYKYLTQEGSIIIETFDNAVCNCVPANNKVVDLENMTNLKKVLTQTAEDQHQAWLYDPENNTIIVVTNYTGGRLLRTKNGKSLSFDEIEKIENAEIKTFTQKEFAESDYNWLANDVRSTMNEAGKYVTVGMGVTFAAPYVLSGVVGEETAKRFAVGFASDFVSNSLANVAAYLIVEYWLKDGNEQKENWTTYFDIKEMIADATLAGFKNLYSPSSLGGKIFYDAVVDGAQAVEVTKSILEGEETSLTEQLVNFGIGAGTAVVVDLVTPKLSQKLAKHTFTKAFDFVKLRQAVAASTFAKNEKFAAIINNLLADVAVSKVFKFSVGELDEKQLRTVVSNLLTTDQGAVTLNLIAKGKISIKNVKDFEIVANNLQLVVGNLLKKSKGSLLLNFISNSKIVFKDVADIEILTNNLNLCFENVSFEKCDDIIKNISSHNNSDKIIDGISNLCLADNSSEKIRSINGLFKTNSIDVSEFLSFCFEMKYPELLLSDLDLINTSNNAGEIISKFVEFDSFTDLASHLPGSIGDKKSGKLIFDFLLSPLFDTETISNYISGKKIGEIDDLISMLSSKRGLDLMDLLKEASVNVDRELLSACNHLFNCFKKKDKNGMSQMMSQMDFDYAIRIFDIYKNPKQTIADLAEVYEVFSPSDATRYLELLANDQKKIVGIGTDDVHLSLASVATTSTDQFRLSLPKQYQNNKITHLLCKTKDNLPAYVKVIEDVKGIGGDVKNYAVCLIPQNDSEWEAFAIGVDADVVKNPDLRRGFEEHFNNRDKNK